MLYALLLVGWAATGTAVPLTAHTHQPTALHLAQAALAVLAARAPAGPLLPRIAPEAAATWSGFRSPC